MKIKQPRNFLIRLCSSYSHIVYHSGRKFRDIAVSTQTYLAMQFVDDDDKQDLERQTSNLHSDIMSYIDVRYKFLK